jgi:hypothetical protein
MVSSCGFSQNQLKIRNLQNKEKNRNGGRVDSKLPIISQTNLIVNGFLLDEISTI